MATGCSVAGRVNGAERSVRFQAAFCDPRSHRKKPNSSAKFIEVNMVPSRRYRIHRGWAGVHAATADRA